MASTGLDGMVSVFGDSPLEKPIGPRNHFKPLAAKSLGKVIVQVSLRTGLGMAWAMLVILPAFGFSEDRLREVIDREVENGWKVNGIAPAKQSSEAEFLRRVFLDLVGVIPTYEETLAFLGDPNEEKRQKLIAQLLDDPRFASHQAEVWDQVLFGRNPPGYGTDKRDGFQNWLRKQFADNIPYDQWVRAILIAEGNSVDDGPPMYLVQYRNQPEDATEAVTQTFLGIQLQCARCHDHPFEEWTQLDFHGTAAFFTRLQVVEVGKKNNLAMYAIGEKSQGELLLTGPVQEQEVGQKGQPVGPKFLDGEPYMEPELPKDFKEDRSFPSGKMPPKPKFSRKDQLAHWISRPDNPYLARAVANRVWSQFLGRGLVHPVDNMSESNTPSHPELLKALTQGLVEHQFDLKWYISELVNSRTYQLAGTGPVEEPMPQWFQQARARPLTAEELLDSWNTAVGYKDMEKLSGAKPSTSRYAPLESGYLMRFFGTPNNGVGDFQGGLHEHLYLNNGGISRLLSPGKGGLYDSLINSQSPWEERIDRLFLSILSRPPTAEERDKFVAYFTAEKDPKPLIGEAIWVLLTCSEFRFNH